MGAESASFAEPLTSLRFASNPQANGFDALLQFGKVRPRPVDLLAARTPAKLVVINFGQRLEFVADVALGCLLQQCVASQAARERGDQSREVKTPDNFGRLFVGILGARGISVLNDRVHEQTPIPRQKRSIFARHYLEQLSVVSVLGISNIKSEKAKIAGKASQVSISDKP